MILSNISGANIYLEEYQTAEDELKALISDIGDRGHFLLPEMYRFLTEALLGQSKFDEAHSTALRSLKLSLDMENHETIGEAWRVLGVVSSCLEENILIDDKTLTASDCFQQSIDIFAKLGMEANHALALHNFANHKLASDD